MRPQCGPPTHLLLSDLLPCIFVCYLVHQLVGGYQIEMQLSFLSLDRQALLLPTSKGVGTPACLLLHHAPCLFPHLVLTCANNMFTMTSRCYLLIADILVAVVINLLHVWPPMWNPTFVFYADPLKPYLLTVHCSHTNCDRHMLLHSGLQLRHFLKGVEECAILQLEGKFPLRKRQCPWTTVWVNTFTLLHVYMLTSPQQCTPYSTFVRCEPFRY